MLTWGKDEHPAAVLGHGAGGEKKNGKAPIKIVAARDGNQTAICRKWKLVALLLYAYCCSVWEAPGRVEQQGVDLMQGGGGDGVGLVELGGISSREKEQGVDLLLRGGGSGEGRRPRERRKRDEELPFSALSRSGGNGEEQLSPTGRRARARVACGSRARGLGGGGRSAAGSCRRQDVGAGSVPVTNIHAHRRFRRQFSHVLVQQ